MQKKQPINTFTRKPNLAQILSYLIFILVILVYAFCVLPLFQKQLDLMIFSIVLGISGFTLIVATCITSFKDPTDPNLLKIPDGPNIRTNQHNPYNLQSNLPIEEFDKNIFKMCQICNGIVFKHRTKHCNRCNRCVREFDHHCIWINNCIGKKNYKSFLIMIISLLCYFATFQASAIYTIIQLQSNLIQIKTIIIWSSMGIVFIFLVMDSYLIGLHIYLFTKGMTTYQMLIANSQRTILKMQQSLKTPPNSN